MAKKAKEENGRKKKTLKKTTSIGDSSRTRIKNKQEKRQKGKK